MLFLILIAPNLYDNIKLYKGKSNLMHFQNKMVHLFFFETLRSVKIVYTVCLDKYFNPINHCV